MPSLLRQFKAALKTKKMIAPSDGVLVAVSGGVDSSTLLHLFKEIQEEWGLRLHVAHLNHQARGEQSNLDAEFVRDLCRTLDIPCRVKEIDVKAMQKNSGTSFQEVARRARYEFFEEVGAQTGSDKVALGHHADDQVETVLLNLLRGSGLKGLAGIPQVRGAYIRPLSQCLRTEIESYAEKNKIPFREDPTNSSSLYKRNRIRLDLTPYLQKNFNANLKSNILETAQIIRDDDEFIQGVVEKIFPGMIRREGKSLAVMGAAFLVHPLALQRRLLRRAFFELTGSLSRVSYKHIESVLGLFKNDGRLRRVSLPHGATAWSRGADVVLDRDYEIPELNSKAQDSEEIIELKVPGSTRGPLGRLQFATKVATPDEADSANCSTTCAHFDFDKTGPDIRIRLFRPGDRFVPLGMSGHKKLKSFFIDQKVPRELRGKIPILTTAVGDIIWVYGKRISNLYKVGVETRKILIIEGASV